MIASIRHLEAMGWTIAASAETRSATVALCHAQWKGPFELTHAASCPTVGLNLSGSIKRRQGRFADMAGAEYLAVGDLVFQPADTRLQVRGPAGDQTFLHISFHALFEGAPVLAADPADTETQRRLMDIRTPELAGSVKRMAQEMVRPGMASDFLIDGLTMLLAVDLARGFSSAVRPRIPSGGLAGWQLHRVRERIAAVDMPPPCLSELATSVRLSPRHLSRAWRASTNTTLSQAVETARQARAEAMVRAGDRQLKEIAYLLGFSSPSSFSSAFRRRTGVSPQEFQRRN